MTMWIAPPILDLVKKWRYEVDKIVSLIFTDFLTV
jgi:hypothetical protein